MPVRTYTNVDFIDYVPTEVLNNGTDVAVVTPTSQFNVTASSSGNDAIAAPGTIESNVNLTYNMAGNLDFDAFPAIPENALITRVEAQIDVEGNGTAEANVTGLDSTNVNASGLIAIYTFINAGELPDIRFEESQTDDAPGELQAAIAVTGFDHYTATQTFDYSGSPISKATLVTDFTAWLVQLRMSVSAQSIIGALSVSSGTTEETAGMTFSGIRITVTYESGPEISLSPSGGNVEVGQTIQVTGPNLEENTYAAIIGDKIVPLELSENFTLEIPYPPTDACFDCFGTCPECETCFDVCDEDLTGEDCQACIEACLECLTECLESLELAEACQQSTGEEPTSTIPVVIIVGGPGFSGTVTLGNFIILVSNGSGLYRFVLGKTNDTLYTAERDGTTYDVKIPNPGAKTGFFRS